MPPADPEVPIRVLLVDDEPHHLKLMAVGLELDGFSVETAGNAEEALRALGRGRYDLAVVDMMMPGMNGLELSRYISGAFPEVQVFLMSAYHVSDRQLRLSNCGAVGFIPKPYRFEDVTTYLRSRVGRPTPLPHPQGSGVPT
jgi:DNA-binding response OmpR family regulator